MTKSRITKNSPVDYSKEINSHFKREIKKLVDAMPLNDLESLLFIAQQKAEWRERHLQQRGVEL